MNKLSINISVALEDAKNKKNKKIKVEGRKEASKCFYIEVTDEFVNLYIGSEKEMSMSNTHYDACIIKIFETYIKF
jgi:hypothetical protein